MPRQTAKHLAEMKGAYEPQRTFNYVIEFDMPGADTTTVSLVIDRGFMPAKQSDAIELHYGNEVQYAAGKVRWEFGQLSIRDMVDKDIAGQIEKWAETVHDPRTGDIQFANKYKTQGHIIMMGPDGSVERTWTVIGLWPQAFSYSELAYDQNDIVRINVTIAFDRAYRT